MMENFKALKSGRLCDVNPSMLFPLLRWSSGSIKDLKWCATVNKYMFWVDKEIVKGLLYLGLQDHNPFQKYPKATKQPEDKKATLMQELACKFYGWGPSEYAKNASVMQYVDWAEVAKSLGCDRKQCKLLGVPEPKFVKPKVVPPAKKAATLFDF
jgi:hypothetical protein